MTPQDEILIVTGVDFDQISYSRENKILKIKGVFKCDNGAAECILIMIEKGEDIAATREQIKMMNRFGLTYVSAQTEEEIAQEQKDLEEDERRFELAEVEKDLALEWFNKLSPEDKEWAKIYAREYGGHGPAGG